MRAFETVFEVYFSLHGNELKLRSDEEGEGPEGEDGDDQQSGEGQSGMAGSGGDAMSPEEIAEMLYRALMEGDGTRSCERCRAKP